MRQNSQTLTIQPHPVKTTSFTQLMLFTVFGMGVYAAFTPLLRVSYIHWSVSILMAGAAGLLTGIMLAQTTRPKPYWNTLDLRIFTDLLTLCMLLMINTANSNMRNMPLYRQTASVTQLAQQINGISMMLNLMVAATLLTTIILMLLEFLLILHIAWLLSLEITSFLVWTDKETKGFSKVEYTLGPTPTWATR